MNRVTGVGIALTALASFLAMGTAARAQEADGYGAMLDYLAQTRIDDRAFTGASGAIAVNMAAGDLNQQANLRAMAVGERASVSAQARQTSGHQVANAPDRALAVISGSAFQDASGIASINQASGVANTELNVVAVALAQRGIRETTDEMLAGVDFASAGQQHHRGSGAADAGTRDVAVDATALQGFEGVMQLNQIAGSGNATGNSLLMSVQTGP